MIVGWIGLALLLIAWSTRLTNYKGLFFLINCIASYLLLTHAIMLGDVPFIIVNGFIGTIALWEVINGR
jgi:hypothetical protein|tara:strand:- start:315 stop:521 length:207 start_codon:yes stop_codon:yes gene_type:complete